jgi:hypothetical protein
MKVTDLIFLQTLQIVLTIDGETISLSITEEKTHGSSVKDGLGNYLPRYPQSCQFFIYLFIMEMIDRDLNKKTYI